jgi:biotin carboxyl carrier protein
MKYIVTLEGQEYMVEVLDEKHVSLDGQVYAIDFQSVQDQPVYSLLMEGISYEAYVSEDDGNWEVMLRGDLYTARVEDEREKRLKAAAGAGVASTEEFHLKAPMPGLIVNVPVEEGQEIAKGDVLVILESMKMQNELRSPKDGRVVRIRVGAGDSVEQKETLLSVE